jgi:3-oxoacyl-[acyl-carrier protein] reductase
VRRRGLAHPAGSGIGLHDCRERAPARRTVAAITGGAQGIGFATARRLAADGARVVLLDRDGEAAEKAAAILTPEGADASGRELDVTDEHSVGSGVQWAPSTAGRIDVLVNNAGIYPHTFEELTLTEWRRVRPANLDGTFLCARAVYPHMRTRLGPDHHVSSATFFIGYPR